MTTIATTIGYIFIAIAAVAIALFAFGFGWFAIQEASTLARMRKANKERFKRLKMDTARDCALYLLRWNFDEDMTIYGALSHFDEILRNNSKTAKQ